MSRWRFVCSEVTVFVVSAMAPADVLAEGLALRLGLGEEERQDHLVVHIEGVRVLLLEEHADAEPSELADGLNALQRIAGKAGGGLRDNKIDLSFLAVFHQLQELLTLFHGGARGAFIRIHTNHRPVRVFRDLGSIVFDLCPVTGQLFIAVR